MTIPFTYVVVAACSLGYVALLFIIFERRRQAGVILPSLLYFVLLALLSQAVHIFVPNAHLGPYAWLFMGGRLPQPALGVLLASLMLVAFTVLSVGYLKRSGGTIILIVGLLWWIGLVVVTLQTTGKDILGQPGWLNNLFSTQVSIPAIVAIAGWTALTIINLLFIMVGFARAHLPEVANQVLFWLLILPLIVVGMVLGASGTNVQRELGWIVQLFGAVGAVYAAVIHRIFDVRQGLRLSFNFIIVTIVTALLFLGALFVSHSGQVAANTLPLILIVIATITAVLNIPLRAITLAISNQLFGYSSEGVASLVRRYSQRIGGTVELNELARVISEALRETLRVKRGGLLLATRDNNEIIRLEPMDGGIGELPLVRGWIANDNPIYQTLLAQRSPLMQYDIEYSRKYEQIPRELKSFFNQLKLSAYAPIVMQDQLIGLLGVGAKNNDDSFSPQDLELFTALANQTGGALRNARLFSDLKMANSTSQNLNQDLLETKERLEQLDSVKTDFITIASHELRTPLAQIRGYTDILDALNDQGMMDPDQLSGMTSNLRKATDRLEKLIADMLDVSQLGLDAMDLRFTQTTIDSVMRLAIEPLAESIKQRKLLLTARGLKGLPSIEADMQRLVQAFRNIVLNAIKYTPDGGRIEISAHMQKNEQTTLDEIVVVISDTGIGIDSKNFELIFEKFFRVSDPGLHSTGATKFMGAGPGLGLTIARGVIQGHGGRIYVDSPGFDSEKMPGTKVYVHLPINPPKDARRVAPFENLSATQTVVAIAAPAMPTAK